MKKKKIVIISLASVVALLIVYIVLLVFLPLRSEERIVHIKPGDNARIIASKLSEAGIIRSKTMFVALTKIRKADRELKPGSYIFGGNTYLWQTVSRLQSGQSETITITFPEGLSLYKTLRKIDHSGLADYNELYLSATNFAQVKKHSGFEVPSLEGFLYPETYKFPIEIPADSILAIMTDEFFKRLHKEGIDPLAIPQFYDKLILASIVEKEAGTESEKEIIAGLFLNRIQKGMALQSCATVNYLLDPKGIKHDVLTYEDTQINSPYNTYLHAGLPPTPICNPSV
ncbi:MAG: endolytic transglycosylase MltG, partial [Candidatus Cloacimonas sp.]